MPVIVLSAPPPSVIEDVTSLLARLDTAVVPAVTTSEFCNAVTALLAAAVLEPVAPANVAAAAAALPVVVKVAAAAPKAGSRAHRWRASGPFCRRKARKSGRRRQFDACPRHGRPPPGL